MRAPGRPGARCTRGPCAESGSTRKSPQVEADQSGLPCAMVLTVSFVLSPVTGLSCHCHPRDAERVFANLTPASGRQDHTTSPSATCALRPARRRVHRIPHSAFVTIAIRPSSRRDGGMHSADFSKRRSDLFLREGVDKNSGRVPVRQINERKSARLKREESQSFKCFEMAVLHCKIIETSVRSIRNTSRKASTGLRNPSDSFLHG